MNQKTMLIDTNVWLDYFVPGRKGREQASDLFLLAARKNYELLYPVRILADVFYIVSENNKQFLRKHYGELDEDAAQSARSVAWDCVVKMSEIATAVGADVADVWYALKLRSLSEDLEDNFVLAAAERVHPSLLVTNDKQLLQHAPTTVLSVEDAYACLSD